MDMKTVMEMAQMVNGEISPEEINAVVEAYKPIVYCVCNEIHNVMKDYANNKELCKTKAIKKKNMFDAYVEAGFSEEIALVFLMNDDIVLNKQLEKFTNITNGNNNQSSVR